MNHQYTYRQTTHFEYWIDRIQGKGSHTLNTNQLEQIKQDCSEHVTYNNIKQSLRKNNLATQYENIPNIYQYLTGNMVQQISKEDKKILINLFEKFNNEFKIRYFERIKNSLPYNYLIKKIANHMNIPIPQIDEIRSIEKLQYLDQIWNDIIKDIDPIMIKRKEAAIKIQSIWRMILAKRYLQRIRIRKELIYLPRIGIEYQNAMKHFNDHI